MLNHILHLFQQHGFVVEESGCWTDLPAVQTFNHLKTLKIQQRRPRTAEQLESYIRQEWDNVPLPKIQQPVFSLTFEVWELRRLQLQQFRQSCVLEQVPNCQQNCWRNFFLWPEGGICGVCVKAYKDRNSETWMNPLRPSCSPQILILEALLLTAASSDAQQRSRISFVQKILVFNPPSSHGAFVDIAVLFLHTFLCVMTHVPV